MMKPLEELLEQDIWPAEPPVKGGFKPLLARLGRLLFSHRLEIGLGVTAVVAPFVRPTIATTRSGLGVKVGGLGLVLAGLAVRMWAAGFAGRHTRSEQIEGSKLATTGPYAHLRNPIYLGSALLGVGMVLLIGDRRLLTPCAVTLLVLYFGLIPAEEEFLSEKFRDEYEAYCRHVPRFLPRLRPWANAGAEKRPFDWSAASGEWRLSLILGAIWGTFRIIASLSKLKENRLKISTNPPAMNQAGVLRRF
jgi:protein-S-isoprenylcysteine O-methyltransferase Ste14